MSSEEELITDFKTLDINEPTFQSTPKQKRGQPVKHTPSSESSSSEYSTPRGPLKSLKIQLCKLDPAKNIVHANLSLRDTPTLQALADLNSEGHIENNMDNATTSTTKGPGEVTQLQANTEAPSGTNSPDDESIQPDKATNTINPQEAEDTTPPPHSTITNPQLHTTKEAIIRTFYYDLIINIKEETITPLNENIQQIRISSYKWQKILNHQNTEK